MTLHRQSVSVYVDIDVGQILEEMTDAQVLEEVERRCIDIARTPEQAKVDTFTPLVEEALAMLQQGRTDDARLTLERALFPKWDSPETALRLFKTAGAN